MQSVSNGRASTVWRTCPRVFVQTMSSSKVCMRTTQYVKERKHFTNREHSGNQCTRSCCVLSELAVGRAFLHCAREGSRTALPRRINRRSANCTVQFTSRLGMDFVLYTEPIVHSGYSDSKPQSHLSRENHSHTSVVIHMCLMSHTLCVV
jgi:hypothetical protein